MADRLSLQATFEQILGSQYVYFQPPESLKLHYPCIVYKKNPIKTAYADNSPYTLYDSYSVTVIYSNPDSTLPKQVASLPMCRAESNYTYDGLYHDVFELYY